MQGFKDWRLSSWAKTIQNIRLCYFRNSKFPSYGVTRADEDDGSFYITYMILSIPGTLLAKAILPSTAISLGCLIWSIAAAGLGGAQSFAGVIVCRLFIGVGESFFGQSVALHYSLW
jgi:branched-subunit amino acid ABC-type transport system permease component